MIDRTLIGDWRHVAMPLSLTIVVVGGGALIVAFG